MYKFKTIKLFTLCCVLLSVNTGLAADAYDSCINCHGEKGEKRALQRSKIIANMSKDEIVFALKGYINNTYGGPMKTLMQGKVAHLSDAQINEIAQKIGK